MLVAHQITTMAKVNLIEFIVISEIDFCSYFGKHFFYELKTASGLAHLMDLYRLFEIISIHAQKMLIKGNINETYSHCFIYCDLYPFVVCS